MLNEQDVVQLLQLRGRDQEDLFERARTKREEFYGQEVVVRGVTEITNKCRVNCEFCPMRRDNTRANNTFQLEPENLVDVAKPRYGRTT